MSKKYVLLSILMLAATAAWAADFWEKKKYTEWSQKDIQKIMKDSPWARTVEVSMGPMGAGGGMGGGGRGGGRRGGGGGGGGGMDASGGGIPGGGGGGAEGGPGGGGAPGGGPGEGGGQSVPTLSVIVRWHSALPIRQALVRARFGDESAKSAEAAKILAADEKIYVVAIAGLPPTMLRGATPESLKPNSLLQIKDRPVIAADRVQAQQDESGRVNLFLIFPHGDKPITIEDNEVEVAVKVGAMSIKRRFRLKDMMFDGKLAI